jgi:hypothetical protein
MGGIDVSKFPAAVCGTLGFPFEGLLSWAGALLVKSGSAAARGMECEILSLAIVVSGVGA